MIAAGPRPPGRRGVLVSPVSASVPPLALARAHQLRAAHQHRAGGGVLAPERVGGVVVGDSSSQRGAPAAGDPHLGETVVGVVRSQVARRRVEHAGDRRRPGPSPSAALA